MSSAWEERFSKTHNAVYYFNASTGETSWTNPHKTETGNSSAARTTDTAGVPTERRRSEEEKDPHPSKKARTGDASIVTTSYQPPVSGSASDVVSTTPALSPPHITPQLPESSNTNMWTRSDIQVNDCLALAYRDGYVEDDNGVRQKFKDVTNPLQGRHLYNLVKENRYTRTMEIGFAMGASACWITQAHRENRLNGMHYAIDPNQTKQYQRIGYKLVERCGTIAHLTLVEKTSYRAMPAILEEVLRGEIPKFHLIYIDGWHTFDYTLVDFFYADLLLEVNGVIVLDDIRHTPVQKAMRYIQTNYPHYKTVPKTPVYDANDMKESTQATFIKTALDTREWNYHRDF